MTEVLDDLAIQERTPDVHTASLFGGEADLTAEEIAAADAAADRAQAGAGAGFTEVTPIPAADTAEFRDGVGIVKYSRTEAALADLRTRYEGKRFDMSTAEGDAAARAGHRELVKLRTGLEKKRKEFKAPALAFGKLIDSEAERIAAVIQPLESWVGQQVEAEDKRRAEEEARKAREAEERRVRFETEIARIRGYVKACEGISAERIERGIEIVSAFEFGEEWAEFGSAAALAQAETVKAMRDLLTIAQAREAAEVEAAAERARIEAEAAAERARLEAAAEARRVEAERLAAEKAELELKNAELQARLAAFEAAEKAREEAAAQALRDAQAAEDSLVRGFEENSHRIEFDSVPYIEKAIRTYESMAPHWENDPRPRVKSACLAGRAYLAERLEAAQLREADKQAQAEAKAKADAEAAAEAQAQATRAREVAAPADEEDRLAQLGKYAPIVAAVETSVEDLSDDALAAMPSVRDQIPGGTPPMVRAEPTTDISTDRIEELNGGTVATSMKPILSGVNYELPAEVSSENVGALFQPVTFVEPPAPAADEPPITIGTINDRLGFTVTARFLEGLGFAPTVCKAPGTRFPAADWPRIKQALIAHIEGLQ